MSCSRRDFLKQACGGTLASVLPVSAFTFLTNEEARAAVENANVRWAFLVDTRKCVGCGLCVKACKNENEIPYDAPITRTWVERYVITKDGKAHIDSPMGGRDGFVDNVINGEEIDPENIDKAFFVPKLCNQCENPPCVQVCPVGATFTTPDGVVLVDDEYCIGCRYCIQACPYGARWLHPETRVAAKCTFCYHRLARGLVPACVEVCPTGARVFGEVGKRVTPLGRFMRFNDVQVLKPHLNTKPKVYYANLDGEVR